MGLDLCLTKCTCGGRCEETCTCRDPYGDDGHFEDCECLECALGPFRRKGYGHLCDFLSDIVVEHEARDACVQAIDMHLPPVLSGICAEYLIVSQTKPLPHILYLGDLPGRKLFFDQLHFTVDETRLVFEWLEVVDSTLQRDDNSIPRELSEFKDYLAQGTAQGMRLSVLV